MFLTFVLSQSCDYVQIIDPPSGLAEEFLGALPIGSRFLKLGSWNPFGRVADSMTLLGFLSGLNPILSTALEQAGVKNGQREAYPELRYDPQTGKMQAIGPGIMSALAFGMVPQLEPLANLTGLSNSYANMARTNPEAAVRSVASAVGIPVPISSKTAEQSIIANERASYQAMTEAAQNALRTGDFSRAKQFPGLASWIATVQAMAERGDFQRGAKPPPIPGSAAAYNQAQQSARTTAPVQPAQPAQQFAGSVGGGMRAGGV